jgi:hypothetical protein
MNKFAQDCQQFWTWFQQHEKQFYTATQDHSRIERDFFTPLAPQLEAMGRGFNFLAGMNEKVAELVITPDGVIENIALVEALIQVAPKLPNWNFIALKPAVGEGISIDFEGYHFSEELLHFYAVEDANFPDRIDIVVVYDNYQTNDEKTVTNGVHIFLDNFLGELHFVATIDHIEIIGRQDAKQPLIPLQKLPAYLTWREKEFVEKYEGVFHQEESKFLLLTAETEIGKPMIVTINRALLDWNAKASHAWIVAVELFYEPNENGLPTSENNKFLDEMESEIDVALPDSEGYLYVGRQTFDGSRVLFWACKDFRKPSLFLHEFMSQHIEDLQMEFSIFKDKYWRTFDKFKVKV